MQTRLGRKYDLIAPKAADINFYEICLSLANINRFAGATESPVSVAFHTMIADDLAPPSISPWVLAHDLHEFAITDITTPVAEALAEIAQEQHRFGAEIVTQAIKGLKRRHDIAIHAAAGLPMPTAEQKALIKVADLRAMKTERRDFMLPPPEPWGDVFETAIPAPHAYRDGYYGWRPAIVAQRLYQRMCREFPALRAGGERDATDYLRRVA